MSRVASVVTDLDKERVEPKPAIPSIPLFEYF